MVTFDRVSRKLEEEDILIVETSLGIDLPNDLRKHYLQYNGGRPSPRFFLQKGEWYGIHSFLPMRSGNPNIGFEETYEDLVETNEWFPKGYIPFAIDEGGDYFLYGISDKNFGEIAFNQSDYAGDPDRFIIKLSDSFDIFMDSLSDSKLT